MTKQELEAYYKSPAWLEKRQQRLKLDKFQCRLCGRGADEVILQVHHKPQSYNKIPNESVEDDLTTLCRDCHEVITSAIYERQYQIKKHKPTFIVTVERKNRNVAKSEVSIDWIGPSDSQQRSESRPAQQMGKIDKSDYIEEKQNGRGL